MILISGATGQLGSQTVNFLLEKGVAASQISVLARNLEKAEGLKEKGIRVVEGDYDNYTSLLNAFQGVDKLLFISASDIEKRLQQHKNVVEAAKEAGVKHVIYTSFLRKNETNSPLKKLAEAHIFTENLLKESELSYTIVKDNLYLDFIPFFIGDVLNTGSIYMPAGNGKISAALRSEMAEALATIISTTGHENKIYNFTNTEAFSYADVANAISEITGKTIKYVSPTVDEFTKTLLNAGVPAAAVAITADFAIATEQDELSLVSHDLEKLIGRKPTSLKDSLKAVYGR